MTNYLFIHKTKKSLWQYLKQNLDAGVELRTHAFILY